MMLYVIFMLLFINESGSAACDSQRSFLVGGTFYMKEKNHIFRMQFLQMLSRTEFKISLTAVLLVVSASYWQLCGSVWGLDRSRLYSAGYGWIGHAAILGIQVMQMFYILLIFFVGSMTFSDSFFVNRKLRVQNIIVTRCQQGSYIFSGAVVSFLGAFLVIFVPFLFSQVLSLVIFPLMSEVPTVFNGTPSWDFSEFITLFPTISYNHPYFYNLIAIFYMSFCTGVMAVLSYAISFFIRRVRLLIIGIPTILVILETTVGDISGQSFGFSYYLYMGGISNQSVLFYFIFPLSILAVSCLMIYFRGYRMRDELL